MADLKYRPVPHDHEAFLKRALKRKGFPEAYDGLGDEYALARELLRARSRAGLTQEAVAERMGTTKTAVSRLEAVGRHSPSVTTLKKYAQAVGCEVEIRLVPAPRPTRASSRRRASAQRNSSP
jgi:DNA-binding XRE family transcriptional regulator